MTSLADLEIMLNDLVEGGFARDEAVVRANELAEAVVEFIAGRTSGGDPPPEALDDVVGAAALAQQGYEGVGGRFDNNTPERGTLTQLSAYWEMRAASARLEASVVRNRSAMAATVAAPATPTSRLRAFGTKAAASTTSVDVAEVTPKLDLGPSLRDRRPEARAGDVPTRQATGDDLGAAEQFKEAQSKQAQFKQAVEGIARRRGERGIDQASTSSKGTDPTALELSEVPRGKGREDGR
jgi:hypothetical protein